MKNKRKKNCDLHPTPHKSIKQTHCTSSTETHNTTAQFTTKRNPTKRNKEVHNIYFYLKHFLFLCEYQQEKWIVSHLLYHRVKLPSSPLNSYNFESFSESLVGLYLCVCVFKSVSPAKKCFVGSSLWFSIKWNVHIFCVVIFHVKKVRKCCVCGVLCPHEMRCPLAKLMYGNWPQII